MYKYQQFMTEYRRRKASARCKAIEWQAADAAHSWEELAEATAYFEKLGRRYGLLREFRENGIIYGGCSR